MDEETRARIRELERTVNGNGELGIAGRVTVIESYIKQHEKERENVRSERRKLTYGVYGGIILMILKFIHDLYTQGISP